MGRVNKTTEGVFVNIMGTSSKRSSYDQFIIPDIVWQIMFGTTVTRWVN